jgi:uncharacterized protein (TIGR00251 family)
MESKVIYVKLTPKASSNRIGNYTNINGVQTLNVYITSVPEYNKANNHMIKLLSDYFNCNASSISIIKGSKSRYKTIIIKII